MKLSTPFALFAILPLITHVSAGVFPRQNQQGGRNRGGNNNGGNNNNTGGNNSTNTGGNNGGNNSTNTGGNNGGNNGGNDPQTSLTLDPRVIAKGFANDGQDVPEAGQVPSLTSTNNFINFCLTVPNLPITNGQQIQTGSCNPAPIGTIPSSDKMPSSKFTNPKNGDTIPSNQAFTISMAISNLATGNFVNAQENYFAAPQQVNSQGLIVGHSHVVVELLDSLDQTTTTDPKKFAFFKGLNAAASNGVLTADVTNGLPAGAYRLCSINAAANHQPAIVPIAQHGSLDDCVYFTATPGGAANNGNSTSGNNNGGAANGGNNNGGAANGGNNNGGNSTGGAANGGNNSGTANGGNNGATGAGGAANNGTATGGNTGNNGVSLS
ncbi:hypothetical protein AN958_04817 [Leucoagaricus sp. SymC.cos]|nr:hypothetical protein AN958_04817 [Leucoagaricus sp. SymC.cos]